MTSKQYESKNYTAIVMTNFGTKALSLPAFVLMYSISLSVIGSYWIWRGGMADHASLVQVTFELFALGAAVSGAAFPFKTGRALNVVVGLGLLVGLIMCLAQFLDFARYSYLAKSGASVVIISLLMFTLNKWWLLLKAKSSNEHTQ